MTTAVQTVCQVTGKITVILCCSMTMASIIATYTNTTADVGPPPKICGGVAGVACPPGYKCEYFRTDMTDAQGVCKKLNEPPRPPLLLSPPNTSQTVVAIDPRQAAVELRWQNNGDPDGDPVAFWITLARWDSENQRWEPVFTDWASGASFTFTSSQGLASNACYTWQVLAIDSTQRSKPSSAASDWSVFCTATAPKPQSPGQ